MQKNEGYCKCKVPKNTDKYEYGAMVCGECDKLIKPEETGVGSDGYS